MKKLKLALLLTSLLALAPVMAQDDLSTPDAISLRNQILQLQSQVNALQAAQSGAPAPLAAPVPQSGSPAPTAAPSSDLVAGLVNRVASLEDQVRMLNGEVQDLTNQLQTQNQSLTKQIGDINFQLQGGAAAAPGAAPGDTSAPAGSPGNPAPQSSATPGLTPGPNGLLTGTLGAIPADQAPAAPPPDASVSAAPTAADTLQLGTKALMRKDYPTAIRAAKSVLTTNRATTAGYDAQFLLARALAGKHDWQNAAVAYDDTFKRARFGSHSQDAQLGEARALLELGDGGAACGALSRLAKQYPNPRADLVPAITRLHSRACGA